MTDGRYVIVPAGGIGSRMGLAYPKQLLPFRGQTVIAHILDLFADEQVVVPVPRGTEQQFHDLIGHRAMIVKGGETRYGSVRNGFEALGALSGDDLVLIHDAARPFLDPASLPAAWAMAAQKGAVIYGAYAVDTIKQVDQDGWITGTLDRRRIVHAQTPQIFQAHCLQRAYAFYDRLVDGPRQPAPPTDEAGLVERAGMRVAIFEASHSNCKLTHPEDRDLLNQSTIRIGHGYDVHCFDAARPLYLGGIEIPDSPGLAGHSDADVVLHALIDALLGAVGRGDIGQWFPDTDTSNAGIRSTEYLAQVWRELCADGYGLGNADITIQAQTPKLAPHIPAMRQCIAAGLDSAKENVNVKATTTEGLGFVGRKEGIAAHAVVILQREAARV